MKSGKKLNLPPIPGNILHNRSPSANQSSDEQDKEKIKKYPQTQIAKALDHQSIPDSIPKYRPPKSQSNLIQNNNTIVEETKTYVENLKKGAYNILVCVRSRHLSPL